MDDFVCDWLAARTDAGGGYRHSRKNADLVLLTASHLRSGLSKPVHRADVLNRKATIELGTGWVHLELARPSELGAPSLEVEPRLRVDMAAGPAAVAPRHVPGGILRQRIGDRIVA